jgi:hypothetical protein
MKNTYWCHDGLYQQDLDTINKLMPSLGYTDNQYMNLFIAMSHAYYDSYNNGGCNLFDCFKKDIDKYVRPFFSRFSIQKLKKDSEYLEKFANKVIEIVRDKELSYTKYAVYCDFKTLQISMTPREGFEEMSSGEKSVLDEWVKARVANIGDTLV